MMADHAESLRSLLKQTPANGDEFEARIAAAATKLFVALGGRERSELSEHGRGVIYLDALDDVCCWAVEEAVRRWFRAEWGTERDYRWPPDPATLRFLAREVEFEFKARIRVMDHILTSRKYIDCTKQLEDGRKAWCGLRIAQTDGKLNGLTFRGAIALADEALRLPRAKPGEVLPAVTPFEVEHPHD
jgi:hypothetical protein